MTAATWTPAVVVVVVIAAVVAAEAALFVIAPEPAEMEAGEGRPKRSAEGGLAAVVAVSRQIGGRVAVDGGDAAAALTRVRERLVSEVSSPSAVTTVRSGASASQLPVRLPADDVLRAIALPWVTGRGRAWHGWQGMCVS